MKRFRMGKQMLGILEVLNELKNPEGHGYQEADCGIDQTEIILIAEELEPIKLKKKKNRDQWIKPREESFKLVKELRKNNPGKIIEVNDNELLPNVIIDMYECEYEYEPKDHMRLASALMGKEIGRCKRPYNMRGIFMILKLVHENPDMKNDPIVKPHFDWLDDLYAGEKKADKLYASYSRSIKILLENGLISSRYKLDGEHVRWFRSRYLITDKGKDALAERVT